MDQESITPLITHHFDDFGERYNYLTYRFDGDHVMYMARAELFAPHEVTLSGPYSKDTLLPTRRPDEALRLRASKYLELRFRVVRRGQAKSRDHD